MGAKLAKKAESTKFLVHYLVMRSSNEVNVEKNRKQIPIYECTETLTQKVCHIELILTNGFQCMNKFK